MLTDGDCIYHGKHSIMYRIAKSLCGTPKINITFYVNSSSIKKQKTVVCWN